MTTLEVRSERASTFGVLLTASLVPQADIPCDERSIAMVLSSSPTPIFCTSVWTGRRTWPIHLPKLHIVTVGEPPGGFDGGPIINTIEISVQDCPRHDFLTRFGLEFEWAVEALTRLDSCIRPRYLPKQTLNHSRHSVGVRRHPVND
jgi:hypothetical protein